MEKDKLLAMSAYAFGIPALYILLTDWRKDNVVGRHGGQAFIGWAKLFLVFFGVRLMVNLIWLLIYIPHLDKLEMLAGAGMWGYLVFRGYQELR